MDGCNNLSEFRSIMASFSDFVRSAETLELEIRGENNCRFINSRGVRLAIRFNDKDTRYVYRCLRPLK